MFWGSDPVFLTVGRIRGFPSLHSKADLRTLNDQLCREKTIMYEYMQTFIKLTPRWRAETSQLNENGSGGIHDSDDLRWNSADWPQISSNEADLLHPPVLTLHVPSCHCSTPLTGIAPPFVLPLGFALPLLELQRLRPSQNLVKKGFFFSGDGGEWCLTFYTSPSLCHMYIMAVRYSTISAINLAKKERGGGTLHREHIRGRKQRICRHWRHWFEKQLVDGG